MSAPAPALAWRGISRPSCSTRPTARRNASCPMRKHGSGGTRSQRRQTMLRYGLVVVGVVALAGCSGGAPSDADIKKAMQALEQRTEITKVEKSNCADAGEGRYR